MTAFKRIPNTYLAAFILLLAVPAFLVNIHLAAFIGDEAIRALVALEMKLSGNYVATTMNGASYINKPPLFNWLLLLSAGIWGGFGEWPSRLTTVFFLGLFGFTVYRAVRPQFGREFAFVAALLTVTSGRFLIYDSMLGLIDTTFSLVIYLQFIAIYFYGKRGRWLALFLSTYLITATAFMLKGLPALVFQALSVASGLWFFGQWRRLFSWQHAAGIGLLAALLGAYCWIYAQYRPLEVLLPNLLNESVKRTVVEHGWSRFVRHLFKFPVDWIYHFLPFSLTFLCWFDRGFRQRVRQNDFVSFNLLMLLVNLPVYWTSVHVEARYLLMFIPLFTVINLYLLQQQRAEGRWQGALVYWVFGATLALSALVIGAMPFLPKVSALPHIGLIAAGLSVLMAGITVAYLEDEKRFLWWFGAGLLVFRLTFGLVVLPIRRDENKNTVARQAVYDLADKYADRHWWLYGWSDIREPAAFYFTNRLGYIVRRNYNVGHPNAVYLVNPVQYPYFQGRLLDTLQTDYPEVVLYLYEVPE